MKRNAYYNTTVQHLRRSHEEWPDFIEQAYQTGKLIANSAIEIYGVGAERGTWKPFVVLHVGGMPYTESIETLTHFTTIYNTALRNQSVNEHRTIRKFNYWLTQKQEIFPVLTYLGLMDLFNQEWDKITDHDAAFDLEGEHDEHGKIVDWENRTKTTKLPLLDYQDIVLDHAIELLADDSHCNDYGRELLGLAFIEGFSGLALGTQDMGQLAKGLSLVA